jgi:hypothetical protein
MVTVEEVADAIVAFCLPDAATLTGQTTVLLGLDPA